jgi:hypothetical protein
MLPMFIGQFIEFSVAMTRIQKFLLCDEINDNILSNQVRDGTNAVEFRDQNSFHWGFSQDPEKAKKGEVKDILKKRKLSKMVKDEEEKLIEESQSQGSPKDD